MRRLGNFLFTSESVTEGHPDKMADQISDAVLDAILTQGPRNLVANRVNHAIASAGMKCITPWTGAFLRKH